jgi:integrase
MARPTKLTDSVADKIVLAVRGASTFNAAARFAGVGETTFYRWLSRGRAERLRLERAADELEALPKRVRSERARKARIAALRAAEPKVDELRFLEFVERIEQADGEAQVRAAAQIAAAGATHWRAAAWFLERREPDQLVDYRASRDPAPHSLVFGTSTGRENGATNIRRRLLARAVEGANDQLLAHGADPLPKHLTPHSLRRTFASLLFAIGESPPYVMAQMGHTTPNLTLAIYARQMSRRDGEPERLKALVDGQDVDHATANNPLP